MDEPVLPQRATPADAEVASVDWLFEPMWPGTRLMARVERGSVTLTDEHGDPADGSLVEVATVLAAAVRAEQALIDGVWTAQPFVGDGSRARAWANTLAQEGLADDVADPMLTERRRAFVALDLVELDGEALHEVPFQERRRLLESIVDEAVQVRVTPAVRQPLSGWLAGWRANGFTHYLAKHVNSRYQPGEPNEEWLEMPLRSESVPGLIARLIGDRGRRTRRVTDRPVDRPD